MISDIAKELQVVVKGTDIHCSFYHSIGYKEGENLFTTQDGINGAFDTMDVMKVIREIKETID